MDPPFGDVPPRAGTESPLGHLNRGSILAGHASAALVQQSLVHGYTVGFWWTAGIFAVGAVVCGTLLRRGPLRSRQAPAATAPEPGAVRSEPPSVRLKAH